MNNSWEIFGVFGVMIAVFILGAVTGWIWRRRKHFDQTVELARRIDIGLAVFFTFVALMVSADLIILEVRFNRYVNTTLPRDQAQERCNTETVRTMKTWVQNRLARDNAMTTRDDIAIRVMTDFANGDPITPAEVKEWRDAVAADEQIRRNSQKQFEDLPNC
jgi:hypothetical protein